MNKNKLNLRSAVAIAICFVATTMFISCEKENPANKEISGKWRLQKICTDGHPVMTCSDVTTLNIIYDFKTNNVLTVSGEIRDDIMWNGHKNGKHFYDLHSETIVIGKDTCSISLYVVEGEPRMHIRTPIGWNLFFVKTVK
jgi:hypothetical protein